MHYFGKEDLKELFHIFLEKIVNFLPSLIGAIIVLFVGSWLIRLIHGIIKHVMEKRQLDITLQSFLSELIKWALYIILFLAVIQVIGIPASSFIAVLGTAGLAIGLALQGSLSNFAGGIMILIFKPFRIGDVIEAKGQKGTVKEIGLFTTTLNKFNHEQVIIPNGPLFSDNIINYTKEEKRRVKVLVGISYGSDIKKAKEIMLSIAQSQEKILDDPAPIVFVEELADSSVNLSLRFWCTNDDYWELYFNTIEQIKYSFDANGVEIPFPQRDVHIKS